MNFGQILVIVCFLVIGAFIVVLCGASYKQQLYAHNHYKPVDAVVTASTVVSGKGSNHAVAKIEYAYSVGGQTFEGWRYAYMAFSESAEEQVKRYPLDAHVTAYYNPANPKEAILHNAVAPPSQILLPIFGFVIPALGIGFLYWWFQRRARKKKQA